MNSSFIELQKCIQEKQYSKRTLLLAAQQLKRNSVSLCQKIIFAFKDRQEEFNILSAQFALLNNHDFGLTQQLIEIAEFASGNALLLVNSYLYKSNLLISTLVPVDDEMHEFKLDLNGCESLEDFSTVLSGHKFKNFKPRLLDKLVYEVCFNEQSVEQYEQQTCRYAQLMVVAEVALHKQAILQEDIFSLAKNVNFSQSCAKQFADCGVGVQKLKQQIAVIYDVIQLRGPNRTLVEQGPLIAFSSQSCNAFALEKLEKRLLGADAFLKLVVSAFQELALTYAKEPIIELLSLALLRYHEATPREQEAQSYSNTLGFLLNLREYNSVAAAVRLALLAHRLYHFSTEGDLLSVVFTLRRLDELQVLLQGGLDRDVSEFRQLLLLTALLLMGQQTHYYNARHVQKLLDFAAIGSRIRGLVGALRAAQNQRTRLLFELLIAEASCFTGGCVYGQLFFALDGELARFLVAQFASQPTTQPAATNIRQTGITLLEGVQALAAATGYQPSCLKARFKMVEYMLAGQPQKMLTSAQVEAAVNQFAEIYFRENERYVAALLGGFPEPEHFQRLILNKLAPQDAANAVEATLDITSPGCFKVLLSGSDLNQKCFVYVHEYKFLLRLPVFCSPAKLTIAASSALQPENVRLEATALEQLQNGNVLGFIINRFASLECSLQEVLSNERNEYEEQLEKLEIYFYEFYEALPWLLLGPFAVLLLLDLRQISSVEELEEQVEVMCWEKLGTLRIFQKAELRALIHSILGVEEKSSYELKIQSHEYIVQGVILELVKPTFVEFQFESGSRAVAPIVRTKSECQETCSNCTQVKARKGILKIGIDPIMQHIPLEKCPLFEGVIRYLNTAETECEGGKNTVYIDPALGDTNALVQAVLEQTKNAWQKITSQDEILKQIRTSAKFVYAGHGGGENLMPYHALLQFESLPQAAILGCSSLLGIVIRGLQLEYRPELPWRTGGLVIGCLWDEIGSDLDKFAVAWMKGEEQQDQIEGQEDVGEYECFAAAVNEMKWKWCFGAGIVIFG